MALNLDSLIKSVGALRRSIETCEKNWNSISEDMQDTLQAGVIQNFKVATNRVGRCCSDGLKTIFLPKRQSIHAPVKNCSELLPVKV